MQYKISALIFLKDQAGRFLMLKRAKAPNDGLWSPIGGKLEMPLGESPFECAIREAREETGIELENKDLHLFCMAAEKAYEGKGHWLMFLFECSKPLEALPAAIDEGEFAFYNRAEIDSLPIPETDRQGLWDIYDKYHDRFVALKVDCQPGKPLNFEIEGLVPARKSTHAKPQND
ncbi:NUDIX hydrolase [Pelagicoccus sp. NFK12]|uniref:NUDIX hydrolase n=1 Tax=Pelagicoccus enzymogenes TaxID=2773457 RepID=A0A927F8T2_9BACT|nr:NUDIX hydrolase [Pelagicoccus enzymogenes]MBD5780587.1 NUDIX hydrolase [Pelagicoccus enzymogenes]MDQ8199012.1 NUDIX hydrolase [Pelagicoccus enzymogenes]